MGLDNGNVTNTTVIKMIETQQMRAYDELRELDIEETPESLRWNLSVTEIKVIINIYLDHSYCTLSL